MVLLNRTLLGCELNILKDEAIKKRKKTCHVFSEENEGGDP